MDRGVRVAGLLAAAATLAGCAVGTAVAGPPETASRVADWRRVATQADRTRLRNWRASWLAARAAARADDPAGVAAQGALFDPDRALTDPVPPPDTYRCRTFKLGGKGTATRGFAAYPWSECRIDQKDGRVRFQKVGGTQRPVGSIFTDSANRAVFLGTLVLGDESGGLDYGRDPMRDMAGLVERIGPQRWRIALPEPHFESQLDVIELVPAG